MKKQPPRLRPGRTALLASAASAAVAATALAGVPASATLSGPGVAAGHNITVFHNIDFVAVFGWTLGESVTVTVERNGVPIGTATGAAVDTPEGPGLEVNHGPEGTPLPGDCWEGRTPDIRPGDVISATNGTVTDQVTVDDVRFTGSPSLAGNGDVLVPFVAKRANGTAIPVGFIDSAEFRATSRLRFESTDIRVQRAAGGAPGEYVMRYPSPFAPSRNRDLLNQRQLRNLLLGDGHAIGFGHVAPLPPESMLYEGLGDAPGPAPGCEAAPSAQWKVNSVAPGTLNLANQANGLAVRGVSQDATAVTVALSDNDPATTGNPSVTLTPAPATGRQVWTARFTPQQLRNLNRTIRVTATMTLADGNIVDRSTTVLKDVVRPNEPRASLRPGVYQRPKQVALRAGGAQIRYTLGNGRQAAPTANSGIRYTGRKIRITSTQVLKAVAIDGAGNVSTVARLRYRIR